MQSFSKMAEPAPSLPDMAALRWRCRRGMKELDVLLERYLQQQFPNDSVEYQQAFVALLAESDPVVLDYLLGRARVDDAVLQQVIERISLYFNAHR